MQKVEYIFKQTLRGMENTLILKHLPATKYLLVADDYTYKALGKRIMSLTSGKTIFLSLGKLPKASVNNIDRIITTAKESSIDAIIAVGSGTINDLCKYASQQLQLDYVVFATAPSMNGYVSANASIADNNGNKISLSARPPKAVFCDFEVLSSAPKRLIQSGLGDSLCRSTCQFDWLLSHLLLGTAYSPKPFEWLAEHESSLLNSANIIVDGDINSIETLMKTLLISGEGMSFAAGSFPASQGEHMIAHTLDMMLASTSNNYHGEEIAVTTLTCATMQESLLNMTKSPTMLEKQFPDELMQKYFNEEKIIVFQKAYKNKIDLIKDAKTITQEKWDSVREQLSEVMVSKKYLENILVQTGLRTNHKEMGWSDECYNDAISLAPFTRNRFTVLDLMIDN